MDVASPPTLEADLKNQAVPQTTSAPTNAGIMILHRTSKPYRSLNAKKRPRRCSSPVLVLTPSNLAGLIPQGSSAARNAPCNNFVIPNGTRPASNYVKRCLEYRKRNPANRNGVA